MFFFDPIFIIPMILVALAQWKVRSAFNKYRIGSMAGLPEQRRPGASCAKTASTTWTSKKWAERFPTTTTQATK